jgi:signal peptidase I
VDRKLTLIVIGIVVVLVAARAVLFASEVIGRRRTRLGLPVTQGWIAENRAGTIELLNSIFVALAFVFVILRPFVVQAFWIPSTSMCNTLLVGDRVIVDRLAYRFGSPHRGDIVVFKAPPAADPDGQEFIKRLIALPGDRVRVRRSQLFVNDQPVQEESYIRERPHYRFPEMSDPYSSVYEHRDGKTGILVQFPVDHGDVVVPEGHYFFLGDNRNQSHDGHEWGFVPAASLVGKAVFVFWPVQRARVLYSPYAPGSVVPEAASSEAVATRSSSPG